MKYLVSSLLLSLALLGAVYVGTTTWKEARSDPGAHQITVRGEASKRVLADLVELEMNIAASGSDPIAASQALSERLQAALSYLVKQGIAEGEATFTPPAIRESPGSALADAPSARGRAVFRGEQTIRVWSSNVAGAQKAYAGLGALIAQGVAVTAKAPQYHNTTLEKTKHDALAAAAADARARAERLAKSAAGRTVGRLIRAEEGSTRVVRAYSTSVVPDEQNAKSAYEKDLIVEVTATFLLR